MASTTIVQRTRGNQVSKVYAFTTSQIIHGISFDGHYMWAAGGGTLSQLNLSGNVGISREITGITDSVIDLAFNGEHFGVVYDKDPTFYRTGLFSRSANVLIPKQSLWGLVAINSIAFDGHYYWFLDSSSPSILYQVTAGPPFTIVKQVALDSSYSGLIFDGEFLVTHNRSGISFNLFYFSRSGNKVKTSANSTFLPTQRDGMAFDGEFIYTLQSA